MVASDQGEPPKTSTALVNVTVERNLYSPVISPLNSTVTIPETLSLGVPVAQLTAADADRMVS